jgi:hypothetical protein
MEKRPSKRPLIAVGFFGLPRAMARTLPSLRAQIIEPAAALGEVRVCYHLFRQSWVQNPRSGENQAMGPENYAFFQDHAGELQAPDGIAEATGLETLKAHGDAWRDDFVSLRNLLLQLHSLQRLTQQLAAMKPDLVVFARPDLLYLDSLGPVMTDMLQPARRQTVALPHWQWSLSGYNDRFAVCGADAFEAYGNRLRQLPAFLADCDRPVHAESLLRYALDTHCAEVLALPLRASRVRVNGEVRDESFAPPKLRRRLRWQLREQFKRWLRSF